MGSWVHKLSDVNEENRTAVCENCGPIDIRKRGYTKSGGVIWRCNESDRGRRDVSYLKSLPHVYRKHLMKTCDRCGFIPEDKCQLDIHHLDGNRSNNSSENLQTLCANCHRLVTKYRL